MFSRIRKRFTFTNVALALVLVFAMTGGAYAAKKYVITSTKQISPTVLKQLQGKAGSAGAPGAQGPAGPAGPAGTNGTNGSNGKDGQNGANGNNGAAGSTGATGPAGPSGPTGATGKNGSPGIPGTDGATGLTGPTGQTGFTETLPSGKTETGTWVASGVPIVLPGFGEEALTTSISFTIPLKEMLEEGEVHIITGEGKGNGCPQGSKDSKPEAEPGNLCVFFDQVIIGGNVGEILPVNPEIGELGAGKTGSWLVVKPVTAGEAILANGTWAVTAK